MHTKKANARKKFRKRLLAISADRRKRKSEKITRLLIQHKAFQEAKSLMIYASLPSEVQTRKLISQALLLKKRVYLPSIDEKKLRISLYRIRNIKKDLLKGAYGIPEPKRLKRHLGKPNHLDLIIIPGLAFDLKGGRLGRGKGYFDRFLMKTKKIKKIGIAFKEQIALKIPMSRLDVKMDEIIYA